MEILSCSPGFAVYTYGPKMAHRSITSAVILVKSENSFPITSKKFLSLALELKYLFAKSSLICDFLCRFEASLGSVSTLAALISLSALSTLFSLLVFKQ